MAGITRKESEVSTDQGIDYTSRVDGSSGNLGLPVLFARHLRVHKPVITADQFILSLRTQHPRTIIIDG